MGIFQRTFYRLSFRNVLRVTISFLCFINSDFYHIFDTFWNTTTLYYAAFYNNLQLRNVVRYGLFYACLKGVNYTIFFWFGYFGASWDHLTTEQSGNFLILFNIGSIVGGWICGYFTDRYKVMSKHGRSPIILLFLMVCNCPIKHSIKRRTILNVVLILNDMMTDIDSSCFCVVFQTEAISISLRIDLFHSGILCGWTIQFDIHCDGYGCRQTAGDQRCNIYFLLIFCILWYFSFEFLFYRQSSVDLNSFRNH